MHYRKFLMTDVVYGRRWRSYFGELVLDAGDISWVVVDFDEIRVLIMPRALISSWRIL